MKVGRSRRAISDIVAAVIFFAMLFTVGTGFFMFTNREFGLQQSTLRQAEDAYLQQLHENLLLSASQKGSDIVVATTNSGGSTSEVVGIFVENMTDGKLYQGPTFTKPATSPALPVFLNVGYTASVDTGVVYKSGNNYAIEVLTQAGSTFSTTYPPTATSLAAQALSSGAIGDLYLSFGSYTWYLVAYCSGSTTTYCLTQQGQQGSAFSISSGYTTSSYYVAFSIKVTDLNPNQLNITLDPFTSISQFFQPTGQGGGKAAGMTWYIINNQSSVISNTYSPIVLKYQQPAVLVFAATAPISGTTKFGPQSVSTTSSGVSPGTTATVFIVSHGCKGTALSKCSPTSANYGQNSPYVTTLYY